MLKKIKDILGIEGVKVKLDCPEEIPAKDGYVQGLILLTSNSPKTVNSITIKLIEKYKRGRKDKVLIDEYLLSSLEIDVNLKLDKDQPEELKFKLPLNLLLSDVDKFGSKNPLTKGLASVAKKIQGVQSSYRIEASVSVVETTLDAFTKVPLVIS